MTSSTLSQTPQLLPSRVSVQQIAKFKIVTNAPRAVKTATKKLTNFPGFGDTSILPFNWQPVRGILRKTMSSTSKEEDRTTWGKAEKKFEHKNASEYYDPCQEFADRSIKCMRRNAGDRDMCGDYFQAYRDCKKEWLTQRKLAKANASSAKS